MPQHAVHVVGRALLSAHFVPDVFKSGLLFLNPQSAGRARAVDGPRYLSFLRPPFPLFSWVRDRLATDPLIGVRQGLPRKHERRLCKKGRSIRCHSDFGTLRCGRQVAGNYISSRL